MEGLFILYKMVVSEKDLEELVMSFLPFHDKMGNKNAPVGCQDFVDAESYIDDSLVNEMKGGNLKLVEIFSYAQTCRQTRLGDGNICDLINIWEQNYKFEATDGEVFTIVKRICVIYELKVGKIDTRAIEQVLRYKHAIECLNFFDEVKAVVIGKYVKDIHFTLNYLNDFINVYTYDFDENNEFCLNWIEPKGSVELKNNLDNKMLAHQIYQTDIRKHFGREKTETFEKYMNVFPSVRNIYELKIK